MSSAMLLRDDTGIGQYEAAGTMLNRFWECAHPYPRCSTNKTAEKVRPLQYAVRNCYIQINPKTMVSWLVFDLDHTNPHIYEEANLPRPNLIIQDRTSLKSHLLYAIESVCTSDNARQKPIAYMKAIYDAFRLQLKADLDYNGGASIAKTPGHPWWRTSEIHQHVYSLGELAEYVELQPNFPKRGATPCNFSEASRHCALFEDLRFFAYSIVEQERTRANGSFDHFNQRLSQFALGKNTYTAQGWANNLPLSSLRATVKSVARWTWDHYTGRADFRRGVMRLNQELPLRARQGLAAKRTHQVRGADNLAKVKSAHALLVDRLDTPTATKIARMTGLTRQTIARYLRLMKQVDAHTALPLRTLVLNVRDASKARSRKKSVKNAAHQVLAQPGEIGHQLSLVVVPAMNVVASPVGDIFDG